MNTLKLAFKNIFHKPLNLLISLLLFGLGIGLINFLILLNHQLKEQFDANLADVDLVIGAKGSPLQMILCSMYQVDNPTGNITVKEARAFLNPKHPIIKESVPLSLGDSYKGYRIVGTTHAMVPFYNTEVIEGRLFQHDLEVVVGAAVADKTGLKIGDKFKSSHGFNDDEDLAHDHAAFKVVGIMKGVGSVIDQLILTNASTVWAVHDHSDESPEAHADHDHGEEHHHSEHNHEGHEHHDDHAGHNHGHDHANHMDVNTNAGLLKYQDKEITNLLVRYRSKTNFQALSMPRNINSNTDMQAASPAIEINRLYSMIGSGTEMLRWLAILIAIVSGVSIFLSLYRSMKERKYELSIMRVLGAGRNKIFSLILAEGLILAIIGFVLGFILSHLGIFLLSNNVEQNFRYSLNSGTFLSQEIWVFVVSIVIGLLAALIPAYQAANTDINHTLTDK